MVRLTDRPDMTLDVLPCMDEKQQYNNNNNYSHAVIERILGTLFVFFMYLAIRIMREHIVGFDPYVSMYVYVRTAYTYVCTSVRT